MIADRPSTVVVIGDTVIAAVATIATSFEHRRAISWETRSADLQKRALLERLSTEASTHCGIDRSSRPVTQTARVLARVDAALGDLEGCFEEWSERNPSREANLTINVDVDHHGNALAHTDHEKYGGPLAMCLETAMESVRFPAGAEDLELDVRVQWSEGLLNLAPVVVGHRTPVHKFSGSPREDRDRAQAILRSLKRRKAELEWRLGETKREYAQHHRHATE